MRLQGSKRAERVPIGPAVQAIQGAEPGYNRSRGPLGSISKAEQNDDIEQGRWWEHTV